MRRFVYLLLLALLPACGGSGQGQVPVVPTAPPGGPSVGAVGPSTMARVLAGMDLEAPGLAWPSSYVMPTRGGSFTGYDGCDLARWARIDGSGEFCWSVFLSALDDHPGTELLVFMIGPKPASSENIEGRALQVLNELQQHCQSRLGRTCELAVTGLPSYQGTCGISMTGIPEASQLAANAIAASQQTIELGPAWTPLTPLLVGNPCHQNEAGQRAHARDLLAWLDGRASS